MKKAPAMLLLTCVLCTVLQVSVVRAQGVSEAEAPTPGTATLPGGKANASADCGTDALSKVFCNANLQEMLNAAFQISIRLGAILAVLRIAYAGYLYMGSEDMWSTKTAAKEVFRNAVIGLLILLGVWLILHQIDPRILSLNIMQTRGADGVPCDIMNGCGVN